MPTRAGIRDVLMLPVALINPNTSSATTAQMVAIARSHSPASFGIEGITAPFGPALITDEEQLLTAGQAVAALAPQLASSWSGAIVSGFGDPGLEALRSVLSIQVAGIGEAGMLAAGKGGRRFAVVTTTPDLVLSIDAKAARLGLGNTYAGVVLTQGEPVSLTADSLRLEAELAVAIEKAIARLRVEAVVIGGGPLAVAARRLAPRFQIPIVEPIPAAVQWLAAALR